MDLYPHMPILCPYAERFYERRISSVTFMSAHLYGMFTSQWAWPARWLIHPILGFWGSNVRQNVRFPSLDADKPTCKFLRL